MRVYLKWGTQLNRAEDIAKDLNCQCIRIPRSRGRIWLRILSIPVCMWLTLRKLFKLKPRLIVTQHSHPFATLTACIFKRLHGNCDIVLDCHNGPFVDSPWILFPFANINKLLFRKYTTIVHNNALLERITSEWIICGNFFVLHDRIPKLESHFDHGSPEHSTVFLVPASWARDEPIEVILAAARLRPKYTFKITGSPKTIPDLPLNCELTGYLSSEDYTDALKQSTSVIALSTRDEVLTRASQEALGATRPPIVSDTNTVRSYFADSATYTRNCAEDVARSCDEVLSRKQTLMEQCRARKNELDTLFEKQKKALLQHIQSLEIA